MSELREAAQAALTAYEKFRDVDDIDGLDDAMDRLRAALAQPEAEPEPVAWMHSDGKVLSELAMKSIRRDFASFPEVFRQFSIPLYAHPQYQAERDTIPTNAEIAEKLCVKW